eukprot:scaffold5328_cov51-Phaeocystis_antarctica.AAC.2
MLPEQYTKELPLPLPLPLTLTLSGHAARAVHQGATRQLRHLVQRALHDHQHAGTNPAQPEP